MKMKSEMFDENPGLSGREIIDKLEAERYKSVLPPKDRMPREQRLDEQTTKLYEDK